MSKIIFCGQNETVRKSATEQIDFATILYHQSVIVIIENSYGFGHTSFTHVDSATDLEFIGNEIWEMYFKKSMSGNSSEPTGQKQSICVTPPEIRIIKHKNATYNLHEKVEMAIQHFNQEFRKTIMPLSLPKLPVESFDQGALLYCNNKIIGAERTELEELLNHDVSANNSLQHHTIEDASAKNWFKRAQRVYVRQLNAALGDADELPLCVYAFGTWMDTELSLRNEVKDFLGRLDPSLANLQELTSKLPKMRSSGPTVSYINVEKVYKSIGSIIEHYRKLLERPEWIIEAQKIAARQAPFLTAVREKLTLERGKIILSIQNETIRLSSADEAAIAAIHFDEELFLIISNPAGNISFTHIDPATNLKFIVTEIQRMRLITPVPAEAVASHTAEKQVYPITELNIRIIRHTLAKSSVLVEEIKRMLATQNIINVKIDSSSSDAILFNKDTISRCSLNWLKAGIDGEASYKLHDAYVSRPLERRHRMLVRNLNSMLGTQNDLPLCNYDFGTPQDTKLSLREEVAAFVTEARKDVTNLVGLLTKHNGTRRSKNLWSMLSAVQLSSSVTCALGGYIKLVDSADWKDLQKKRAASAAMPPPKPPLPPQEPS